MMRSTNATQHSLRLAVVLLLLGSVGIARAQPAPNGNSVLILGSSVSGGAASLEATTATSQGFTVVIDSDVAWAARTTADFATFKALILGDPTCQGGGAAASATAAAVANNAVWGPAVSGNVVLIGTDPTFHSSFGPGGAQGGDTVASSGIAFAAAAAGDTGLYATLSCYFDSTAPLTPVPLLAPFGVFTVTGVGCYNDSHIVAAHPALAGLTDASLSNWSCSVHEAFDTFPNAGANAFVPLAIAENIAGAGSITFPDGTFGIPYILARGEAIVTVGCGNGTVDAGEECDDGNIVSGDGCSSACKIESCGNGLVDAGEDCDPSSPTGAFCTPPLACVDCDCVPVATTTNPSTTMTPTTVAPSTTTTTLLNHFQCYEAKRQAVTAGPVSVEDQFGTSPSVILNKPNRLCAPTNKRNEDPGVENDPAHLKSWQDKHNGPTALNQTIVNQFGTLVFDIKTPSFLLVPASKGLNGNPPPLAAPTPDHFQCYKAKRSRGSTKFTKISGVTGVDQFGPYTVDLIRPRWLCAPANKAGEDPTAPTHAEHLLCYKTRSAVRFAQRFVDTTDQFGNQRLELFRRIELCVPSLKNPGSPTTTTTSTLPTTTTTSTPATTTSTPAVTTTVTTSTTIASTTTLIGSPSGAFVEPMRSLLD